MKYRTLPAVLCMILAVMLLCSCAAPASKGVQGTAEWKLSVTGAPKAEFTSADCAKLKSVKLKVDPLTTHCSDGKDHEWEGVPLKDVISALGITDYKTITLAASDDYTQDFTPDMVNDPKTILGTAMDGKALTAEDGFVEVVAAGQKASAWVKKLASIKINK